MNSKSDAETIASFWPAAGLVLALVMGTIGCVLFYLNRVTAVPASWGSTAGPRNDLFAWFNTVQAALLIPLFSGVLGVLVLRRRAAQRIGWLFMALSLCSAVQIFLGEYAILGAYTRGTPLPDAAAVRAHADALDQMVTSRWHPEAYASGDVFVFPSLTDTFGLVLLEALACGVPVAAYPVHGPKDVLTDPASGVLDNDLRAAALKALKLSREAARDHALNFSWENSAQQFLDNVLIAHNLGLPERRRLLTRLRPKRLVRKKTAA